MYEHRISNCVYNLVVSKSGALRFNGDSWLELHKLLMQHLSSENVETIELDFKVCLFLTLARKQLFEYMTDENTL